MRLSLCLPLAVSALAAGSSPPSWAPDHRSTEGPPSRRITHVWAVRHGQAWHNLDRQNGWRLPDPGLTALGWEQATAAAGLLPQNLSLLVSSPLRRTVQTTAAALTALGGPPTGAASGRRVPLVLHPDLQEIYYGPADTGRPWPDLLAEFGDSSRPDEGSSEGAVPLPCWAQLDDRVLRERPEWYLEKERLPSEQSVRKKPGRQAFARRQAQRFLGWLSSTSSWDGNDDGQCGLGPEDARADESESSGSERSVLIAGHNGALSALLPPDPTAQPAEGDKPPGLRNGEVVRLALEITATQCFWERLP